ncbi:MAG: peptidoglycan DD-metalloendopeptidase family protein [Bacteroidales bacterium]|nr:peptidoglycan DD-metalloendopeptidase family protein [Bacteroidales bacterium]
MKKGIIIIFLIAAIGVSGYYLYNQTSNKNKDNTSTNIVIPEPVKENKLYGLSADTFLIETSKVEPGMFLGTLFEKYNVMNKLHSIVKKTEGLFDVRKIRRGQKYAVFFSKDTSKTVNYIVYEKNKTDYVVFDLNDSLNVYTGKKKVEIKVNETGGIIKSSLWFAMEDAGVKPILANDLSEIYAWSIDFFGLQKGDRFKIIYEEKFVNDTSIGYGKILAAYFEHYNDSIYAIPYTQDSTQSFYDLEGNSLKKAFLKAPLKFSRISSGFSYARKHPILKIVRPHLGVDYSAPFGTPVFALGDGTVIHAAYTGGAGNYIKIRHNSVYTTGYMHLKGYASGIRSGVRVTQGQLIGYVGSTGLSTGPHLDFRVWKNGKPTNPLHIEAPPVEPIKEENKEAFNKTIPVFKKWLDKIEYKVTGQDTSLMDTCDSTSILRK